MSTITSGTSAYLNALVKDEAGAAVKGAVVTFTVPNALLASTPAAASALTDDQGKASIQIDAAGTTAEGAAAVTAAATWGKGTTTYNVSSAPLGFAVGSASVTLGNMTASPDSISAYGSTTISVPVLVNGAPAAVPISVAFTSGCVGSTKSSITSPVTTVNGVATTTYKDIATCASRDTITASVAGTSAVATAAVTVAAPVANNVQFVEAKPSVIGISGTGLPTSSVVKFQVVDANNNGVSGKLVNFSVTPSLAAGSVQLSQTSASSDGSGNVTVSLTSGTVPTPVWVVATLAETPTISSKSTALTVTTGLPTQDFFSLSISTHNIEGWTIDGTQTQLNIIASDRLGNPVPDNTAINFVTEGGQVQGGTDGRATCKTTAGGCSVTLKSANSRPDGEGDNGRVTVLAYAMGEKSFIDQNGNNAWDPGETFYDLGDPFINANDAVNSTWDAGEQFWSYNSGTSPCPANPASYSNALSKANTCNGSMVGDANRAYVRRHGVVIFSGSHAFASLNRLETPGGTMTQEPLSYAMESRCLRTFGLWIKDVNNNPMPFGSEIATANNNVTFTGASTGKPMKATITINNETVADATTVGGTYHTFTIDGGLDDCPGLDPNKYPAGTFDLTVRTPSGRTTSIPITIN